MASTEQKEADITQPSAVFFEKNLDEVFEHIKKMNEVADIRKVTLEAGCYVTYEIVCLRPQKGGLMRRT